MLTIYLTTWCGYCVRLKRQLDREGVAYREVDIDRDPAAHGYVVRVNGGYATVPTVAFSDGTTLTNPSVWQVADKLASAV